MPAADALAADAVDRGAAGVCAAMKGARSDGLVVRTWEIALTSDS